jgi:hypothetical protein
VRHRTRVDRAIRDAEETFRAMHITGTPPNRRRRSIANPDVLHEATEPACAPQAPLLGRNRGPGIPDIAYGLGPVWLESWSDMRPEEAFRFQGAHAAWQARLRGLVGNCRALERDQDLPGALRRAARDVVDILERTDELMGVTFVTRRALAGDGVWIWLPADYERFCRQPAGEERAGEQFRLADPEHWLEVLRRAAGANTALAASFPVLPYFDGRPFLMVVAPGDPTGLQRAFDDRYFMASSELNLLNTLLFVAS